jgi:hypothetical protein
MRGKKYRRARCNDLPSQVMLRIKRRKGVKARR